MKKNHIGISTELANAQLLNYQEVINRLSGDSRIVVVENGIDSTIEVYLDLITDESNLIRKVNKYRHLRECGVKIVVLLNDHRVDKHSWRLRRVLDQTDLAVCGSRQIERSVSNLSECHTICLLLNLKIENKIKYAPSTILVSGHIACNQEWLESLRRDVNMRTGYKVRVMTDSCRKPRGWSYSVHVCDIDKTTPYESMNLINTSMSLGIPTIVSEGCLAEEYFGNLLNYAGQTMSVPEIGKTIAYYLLDKELYNNHSSTVKKGYFPWDDRLYANRLVDVILNLSRVDERNINNQLLQHVMISIRPNDVRKCIEAHDRMVDFVKEYVVITNKSQMPAMKQIKSKRRLIVVDESDTMSPEEYDKFPYLTHVQKNWLLRVKLALQDQIDDEFIMLDDDHIPISPVRVDYYLDGAGSHKLRYMDELPNWKYARGDFDAGEQAAEMILRREHMELLMYAIHAPQIINKRIFLEAISFFGYEYGDRYGEWEIYCNYIASIHPHKVRKLVYQTLGWPSDIAYSPPEYEDYISKRFVYENHYDANMPLNQMLNDTRCANEAVRRNIKLRTVFTQKALKYATGNSAQITLPDGARAYLSVPRQVLPLLTSSSGNIKMSYKIVGAKQSTHYWVTINDSKYMEITRSQNNEYCEGVINIPLFSMERSGLIDSFISIKPSCDEDKACYNCQLRMVILSCKNGRYPTWYKAHLIKRGVGNMLRTVIVDASVLAKPYLSGVGQWTLGLVRELDRMAADGAIRTILLLDSHGQKRYLKRHSLSNVEVRCWPVLGKLITTTLSRTTLKLPVDLLFGRGIYIFPNYRNWYTPLSRSMTVIYDVVYKIFPETIHSKNLRYLSANLPNWLNRTDSIVTISKASARDISKYFPDITNKIIVAGSGVDGRVFYRRSRKDCIRAMKKVGIKGRYFMFVGNIEPRKNIGKLLNAYKVYCDGTINPASLLLVGGDGWNNTAVLDHIADLRLRGYNIVRPDKYVKSSDLPALYSGTNALVLISKHEGFGMPVVEAQACGANVIVSNIDVLEEVSSSKGRYIVDPNKTRQIAAAFKDCDRIVNNRIKVTHTWADVASHMLKDLI
ncbi:MAG: glycosyltransferase family 4 protein [Candidatus Nomurabacteria bacterium]|nr:glycosyltransferase family 4 protein [Candidatus Nomurabacteria bacterium]